VFIFPFLLSGLSFVSFFFFFVVFVCVVNYSNKERYKEKTQKKTGIKGRQGLWPLVVDQTQNNLN